MSGILVGVPVVVADVADVALARHGGQYIKDSLGCRQ